MKRRLYIIALTMALFTALFAMGKVGFYLYNTPHYISWREVLAVWRHGLTMDLATAAYLTAPVWLFCIASLRWPHSPARRVLRPWVIFATLVATLVIVADGVLYEHWKFKIDSTIFPYLAQPDGAMNSVSPWLIFFAVDVVAVVTWLTVRCMLRPIPRRMHRTRHTLRSVIVLTLTGGLLFLCMRGGVRESTMNVGVAYFSPRLFLNHAAVNPLFSLGASVSKNKRFSQQFRYMTEDVCRQKFRPLYTKGYTPPADTLLTCTRPNVLIVLLESFGSNIMHKPGVAPNLRRLAREGVEWTQVYANSFRTDRGTVSTLSGWFSYPTVSLMRIPGRSASLPAIARELGKTGYDCTYLYGGDIKIMGKQGYLVSTGYNRLVSISDFPLRDANYSKWGVHDRATMQRALQLIGEQPTDRPWHMVWQTLSSHEPWQVPHKQLADPVLNSFAFTDKCLGQLVDSLRATPQWKDLLIVVIPDHNTAAGGLAYDNPDFFRIPMLWLGGAVKEPRIIDRLMNQSDLAATLLAQMDLPHTAFRWSRDVLSPDYRRPFVYCTYPSGIMLRDAKGVTIFDTSSRRVVVDEPESPARLQSAKAILQRTYTLLDAR